MLSAGYTLEYTKYFTARVSGTKRDPSKPMRQQVLLRALLTLPNFKTIFGSFQSHEVTRPLATPIPGLSNYVVVEDTKEKGSDVNLAAHLVADGYKNLFDVAILVTNDSDLVTPVRMVREDLHKQVWIFNPQKSHSVELKRYSDKCNYIAPAILQASQFPDTLSDAKGVFSKPKSW